MFKPENKIPKGSCLSTCKIEQMCLESYNHDVKSQLASFPLASVFSAVSYSAS